MCNNNCQIPTIESVEVENVHISHVKESLIGNVQLWLKRKLYSSTLSVQHPQRKLDQVMSLTLTPEQASAILEVETFVDSIYVPLRRDKLLSTIGSDNSKRCISVV